MQQKKVYFFLRYIFCNFITSIQNRKQNWVEKLSNSSFYRGRYNHNYLSEVPFDKNLKGLISLIYSDKLDQVKNTARALNKTTIWNKSFNKSHIERNNWIERPQLISYIVNSFSLFLFSPAKYKYVNITFSEHTQHLSL